MNAVKISAHLQSNYEDYYEKGDSEWRWLGAKDKAHNIQILCKDLLTLSAYNGWTLKER